MDPLKGIRVASPCPASWDRMAGDDRVRHCSLCDLNVYNLAELTRDEIRDLVARTEGRLCGRLYRRADGTLLTKDCPTGLQRLQQRMSRAAAAVTAALFSASALLTGCASSRPKPNKYGADVKLKVEEAAAMPAPLFSGVVREADSAMPVPGATVLLCDEAGQHAITTVTDVNGAFSVPLPSDGAYHVEVTLAGLEPIVIDNLVLRRNEVTRAQMTMQLGPVQGILVMASKPLVTQDILSTTYSQDFIDKLPR